MKHNNGEPYRPVYPSDERVIGGIMPPTQVYEQSGLYSRADLELDMEEVTERLVTEQPIATVEDYQYWAEGNWKTVHGTYDSVERFRDKLLEEHREAVDAYDDLMVASARGADLDPARNNVCSELGDLMWCMSALASNGGASLDTGARIYLHKYVLGTQIIRDNQGVPPQWREKAAEISTKWEKINLSDVDSVIEAGFEPAPSAVMNIYDDDPPEYDIPHHLQILLGSAILNAALIQTDIQYGRRNTDGNPTDAMVGQGYFDSGAMRLSEIAAAGLFEVSYIARTSLNQPISSIVSENVTKISGRVREGKVDKSDAPRE